MIINSISMLFGILCSMIDTIITGRFLGTDAVAAAGLSQPIVIGLAALSMLFGFTRGCLDVFLLNAGTSEKSA